MLAQAAIFLTAAVLIVPLARRAGVGAVLGYLAAGIAIGPFGLALITDVEAIRHFAEFGVVLFLFVIGLELQPARLWQLRRTVFGLGSAQVVGCGAALGLGALAAGQPWQAATATGFALALSSTALVLQALAERQQLASRHGRDAFAVLLFQDMAVIPALALLPLLAAGRGGGGSWSTAIGALALISAMILAGRLLLRPAFRWIAASGNREIFTAAALLIVIASTLAMERAGVSASLGAFMAGVLLADSEYRHELEADIEPFKGLLMGLFFIAVGMGANLALLATSPLAICGIAVGLMAAKFAIVYGIGRLAGSGAGDARKLAIALAQGGEFAFVLLALAAGEGVMERRLADMLVVAVTLSLLAAPLLFVLEDRVLAPRLDRVPQPGYDTPDGDANPVVIAGYGRFAQIVSRVLTVRNIAFTALEINPQQVDFVRRYGSKVYFGDAARLDLLAAARVEKARAFVLAVDDVETSLRIAETIRRHYPNVPIFARARNRYHAYKLMDVGVQALVRETWHSSVFLAERLLLGLGLPPSEASTTIAKFAHHDETLLRRQHAVYRDEASLVQSARQAAAELRGLFDSDDAV